MKPDTSPAVTVKAIIVNWNHKFDTEDCIDSLLEAGLPAESLLVVDNGSTDGSVDYLKERYTSSIEVLALDANKGYPFALNQGIQHLLQKNFDWLLLSNNDVIYDKHFFDFIQTAIASPTQPDLIAPNILYYAEPDTIWYMGSKRLLGTMIGVRSYNKTKFSESLPFYLPVDYVHGCSMLVKRSVFDKIGLFDDSDLIYGDDADFSWRAKEAGFNMIAASRAKLWHKIALTMGVQKPLTRYLRIRNQIKFYRKYAGGLHKLVLFFFTIGRSSIMIIKDLLYGRWDLIKPLLLGFADGWTGKNVNRFE